MRQQFAINRPLLRFFVDFLSWLICFQFIVAMLHHSANSSSLIQQYITKSVAYFYNIFFPPISYINNVLIHTETNRFLVVDHHCTALALCATVAAAILAIPGNHIKKALVAITAIFLIQIENIFRISHLMYEVQTINNQFELFHLYVWQLINFLFALCVFYTAFKYLNEKHHNKNSLLC